MVKSGKRKSAVNGRTAAAAVAPAPRRSASRPLWPILIGAAVALFVVFAVYGPALNGPFLLDDDYLPYRIDGFARAPLRAWIGGLRPLLMFSYWLNFQQSGQNTYSYHFFNVLLHLINGGLIFLAVRKLLEKAAAARTWTRESVALFAVGLFLLHPIQTEAVSYIASRSETLSVCFFLAAFVVFLYGNGALAPGRIAAVLALFGLACLSKEHAVILPALLLLTDFYWNPGFTTAAIRRNWKLYGTMAILAALAGAFVWVFVLKNATSAGFNVKGIAWYQYFLTECRVIWKYLFLFVFPFRLNLDPDIAVTHSVSDPAAIAGLAALIGVSVAAWIYRRRFPLASYGWFVFLLLLAPTSSIVPLKDVYAERRLYLPFIGLLLITAEFVRRWKAGRGVVIATLGGLLLVEGTLAYQRNLLWGDAIAMWQQTAADSPHKVRPSFQLAHAMYAAGRCGGAVKQYSQTAAIAKPDFSLLLDWGLAYDCMGDRENALSKLQQAAALEPNAHVYSQIGMEYAKEQKLPEALEALNRAARLDPKFAMTYVNRGNVYLIEGDRGSAANDYRHALALDPENQVAREQLARLAP